MSEKKEEPNELAVKKSREPHDIWDDFFDDLWKNWMMPYPQGMRRTIQDLVSRTKTDLIDNHDSYELHLDVPGIPRDKLSINVTENGIEISGKAETSTEENKKNYVYRERGYSEVYRKLDLPEEIIPEKTEASVNNGVLTVKMSKKQMKPLLRTHKVEVK